MEYSESSANIAPQTVTILGATGSIGVNTLDVIARHPALFRVFALTANHNIALLAEQCRTFNPKYAVIPNADAAEILRRELTAGDNRTEVLSGVDSLDKVASADEVDTVMAAIVGAAGLLPTLAAVKRGKKVLLANKEALVMAGSLFMKAVRECNATLLPIDSEHNAIFQCLPETYSVGQPLKGVRKLLLTGSGGPFRTWTEDRIISASPEEACNHPNWSMGRKISVDSASLMNKGLEFIEARWLFDVEPKDIEVVIHPQSIIHSMVEYTDGSVLAQMGQPDMRTPIANALAWPSRIDSGVRSLDMFQLAGLDFERPDYQRFPALKLAVNAANTGTGAAAVLNAANEVAVDAFLQGRIGFTVISDVLSAVMDAVDCQEPESIEDVLALDFSARKMAEHIVHQTSQ